MTIYDDAQKFNRQVEAGISASVKPLLDDYLQQLPSIVARAQALTTEVNELRRQGVAPSQLQIIAAERSKQLAQELAQEVSRLSQRVSLLLSAEEYQMIVAGLANSQALVLSYVPTSGVTWTTPNILAVQQLIGALRGETFTKLLSTLPVEAERVIRRSLTNGVLSGRNPRTVARELRIQAALPAFRCEVIARTEMLRAYRETTRISYETNSTIVKGYYRLAAKSSRTCVACLALDGQEQETSELLATHPQDRCTVVPILDRARFNLPELPKPESGTDWFSKQSASTQQQVLGKGGYAKYKEGASLQSFVKQTNTDWGPTLSIKRLKDVA